MHRTMEVLFLKVQKSVSHTNGSKEYVKHQIVVPNDLVKQLGWNQGDELEARINQRGLLLYRLPSKPEVKTHDYDEFKRFIIKILSTSPKGIEWSELRRLACLPQKTPSPIWVRKLEDENILIRARDPTSSRIIWTLNERVLNQMSGKLNGWVGSVPSSR